MQRSYCYTPASASASASASACKLNVRAGADPEPPLPGGGAQVTTEAKGFTEARSAERGRVGEGVTPLPQVGVRGRPPPEFFWEIAPKWCILGAFWGNQYTFFLHWKFIWKKCVSLNLHIDYLYFFFKILRNLHQNGAFWLRKRLNCFRDLWFWAHIN